MKKELKKIFLFLGLLVAVSNTVIAQEVSAQIVESITKYRKDSPKEKLYLKCDKEFYLTGEILWFKVNSVDAYSNIPFNMSKVAYVEVLDAQNNALLQAKIGMHEASGSGSFFLPESITSGNYKIRAYTSWMKNFGAETFFERNISIVNLKKKLVNNDKTALRYHIQFFPEGGDLITGVSSNVAYKLTDQYGRGATFSGYLLKGRDTIQAFAPYKDGMGKFSFTPQTSESYKAVIKTKDGQLLSVDMPSIKEKGVAIALTNTKSGLLLRLAATRVGDELYYLVTHNKGVIKQAKSIVLKEGKAAIEVNDVDIADGITYFTLFDENKRPVAERLYFKKPQILAINVGINNNKVGKRNEVLVAVSDSKLIDGESSDLVVSVYKSDSLEKRSDKNILNYFWLTSEFKDQVENADVYFSNDADAKEMTDLLMLTQGWRKYDWEKVMSGKQAFFSYLPEMNGHIVSGKVMDRTNNSPLGQISTSASDPVSRSFKSSISNNKGEVFYEFKSLYGGEKLIVLPGQFADKNAVINISNPYSNQYNGNAVLPMDSPSNYSETLNKRYVAMQVQNIYRHAESNRFYLPEFVDTTSFYYKPDYTYKLDDYTRFTTVEEVLREYVIPVAVRKRGGNMHLSIFYSVNNQVVTAEPLNLLDGVPMYDNKKFFEFDPFKVRSLDVVSTPFIQNNIVYEGVLNWKTFKPDLTNYTLPANAVVLDYEGLQLQREFYAPKYETIEEINTKTPDFRTVLQWTPQVKLKGNNEEKIKFYTSDIAGRYIVVVEGISNTGKCGVATATFDVE